MITNDKPHQVDGVLIFNAPILRASKRVQFAWLSTFGTIFQFIQTAKHKARINDTPLHHPKYTKQG